MTRDRLYTLLICALVYIFSINAFSDIFADVDLWGHLKFGEEIISTKSIPQVNTFSYTAPDHPWINHELLAEIIFAFVYSLAGTTGLLILKLALGLGIIHILSGLYFSKSGNRLSYALHFLLLAPVFVTGFATRPQIFTYFFLALLVWILQKYFDGNHKVIFWTPLLMALWVNTHGGVVAGICIFGAVVFIEVLRRLLTGDGPIKALIAVFLVSCLALFANPYGYKIWLFFLETIPRDRPISEWAAVPPWGPRFYFFKVLVILFVISLFSPAKKRIWEVTMIVLAIFYGFRHGRHTVLTGILMTPYLPLQLAALLETETFKRWRPKISSLGHTAVLFVLTVGVLSQAYFHYHKYKEVGFKIQINPEVYPLYAMNFLEANKIDGNILVFFDWGEYVINKRPASKVSIDGRLWTAYPDEVFRENLALRNGEKGWEEMLDKYPHDIILMDHINSDLENVAGWVKIYNDPIARIFIRKTDPPSPLLEKFYRREFIYPEAPLSWEFP